MSHPITKAHNGGAAIAARRDTPAAPQWPSFRGTPQLVGSSPSGRVTVYIDASFQIAMQNATDLLNDADRVVNANDALFGTTGSTVSVLVWALNGMTDGTGGADHASCDYIAGANIEVCASLGNSARISALFEAELSECSMGGNLCGSNTGEALSRWCAAVISNNALSDFATAPTWAQDGMPDYVSQTDPTDQNADSTGCGMAFLSWLMSQGYALNAIAPTMVSLGDAGTLAQLYANLTSDAAANAWPNFQSALSALPGGVTSDDPFGGTSQPAQLFNLAPWTVDLAGKVFGTILADVAAGKTEHQIVASVRAALVSARRSNPAAAPPTCSTKSHKLRRPGTN